MILIAVVTIASLLPFVNKAFHIDDPLFLWSGRQIAAAPADFYGFDVNWYGVTEPMAEVTKNPPLTSFFIAVVESLTGASEVSLHLWFLLPAVVCALGTYLLARQVTRRPLLATLIALCTPAFLVSSTTVMCDVTMLALWTLAAGLWYRGSAEVGPSHPGLTRGRSSDFGLAALLLALAALTKYFALALLPLLLVHSVVRRRKVGARMLWLLLPVGFWIAYQMFTAATYGRGLLSDAAVYATDRQADGPVQLVQRFCVGLGFTGACLAPLLFLSPLLWSRRTLLLGLLVALGLGVLLSVGGEAVPAQLGFERKFGTGVWFQFGIWFVVGFGLLALVVDELRGLLAGRREGSGERAVLISLLLWISGTFVFASFVNWTVSARNLLPLVPAFGILVARRLDARSVSVPRMAIALGMAAVLALATTWGDAQLANASRRAVQELETRSGRANRWFLGHWGFQYYAEVAGARPLDRTRTLVEAGDAVWIPINSTNLFELPPGVGKVVDSIRVPTRGGVATMDPSRGAGFYSHVWGPLPFVLGPTHPETFLLFRVREDFQFGN